MIDILFLLQQLRSANILQRPDMSWAAWTGCNGGLRLTGF